MYRDYLYLYRCVNELKKTFINSDVIEAFSQQKDTLLIHCPSLEYPSRHLSISLIQQKQFLLIKNDFHRAKKNTLNFFSELFPAKLTNIKIALFERSIKFCFNGFDLIIIIKGNSGNIFIVKNNVIVSSFKKLKDVDDFNIFINSLNFDAYSVHNEFPLVSVEEKAIKKHFPFLSNIFEKEVLLRSNAKDDYYEVIHTLIDEIYQNRIGVFYFKTLNKTIFCPISFLIAKDSQLLSFEFDNYNDALKEYLILSEKNQKYISMKKQIDSYLNKEIEYLSKTLNKLKQRIDAGSKSNEYYKIGNLLKSNYSSLKNGLTKIELEDEDKILGIKLKSEYSPSENVNMYFEKAKDEKKNFSKSLGLYSSFQNKYSSFQELKSSVDSISTFDDASNIFKLLKINPNNKAKSKNNNMNKFREFILEEKYNIYVGKDSKSNDELSLKFSQKNDYWFHARGVPGSHVLLRVVSTKENIPKDIIKKTASIAAFYSKAKTASLVPVSYTFAKYVIKRKGMEPGKVQITNEKVVIVKPIIPTNCLQTGNEDEI
ncbi:MAG: hypothetical protein CO129_07550 [Ignavibacteriales bacterium CG_4_9_14_3_um_filter_34_10]|nr:MAG: hypothetical protein CO129_07550 [Ignavibacteriales bacterium CG_4_9_14_3_um_filter_34_10]